MDYNSVVGRNVYNINSDSPDSDITIALTGINSKRDDVYTYYEYVQFKRAKFDCDNSKTEYDKKTGRIIKMEFKFTGKFE